MIRMIYRALSLRCVSSASGAVKALLLLAALAPPASAWQSGCGGAGKNNTSTELVGFICDDCCDPNGPDHWTTANGRAEYNLLGIYGDWYYSWCSSGWLSFSLTKTGGGEFPADGCPDSVMAQTDWVGISAYLEDFQPASGLALTAVRGAETPDAPAAKFVAAVNDAGFNWVPPQPNTVTTLGMLYDEVTSQDGSRTYSMEFTVVMDNHVGAATARTFVIFHYGQMPADESTTCSDTACRAGIWKDGAHVLTMPGSCPDDPALCHHFLMGHSNVCEPGKWVFEITTATIDLAGMPTLESPAACPAIDADCDYECLNTTGFPCKPAVVLCDDAAFDKFTQCKKYGYCFNIGQALFADDCSLGCVCNAGKKETKPAKWRCGKLKSGKEPEPLCDDCAADTPSGDCSTVDFLNECMLPCLCGTHKKVCDGYPCLGADIPTDNAKVLKGIFKGKDVAKKMCNACVQPDCLCNSMSAAPPPPPLAGNDLQAWAQLGPA